MLPLTFENPDDYSKIKPEDRISLLNLKDIAPGKVKTIKNNLENRIVFLFLNFLLKPVECVVKHSDGSADKITLLHTMNDGQIEWFKSGSALNRMREVLYGK